MAEWGNNDTSDQDQSLWVSNEDFTTVMIVTVSGVLVLGIFLILCLVRFPSYDTIENLLHDKRSFRHEWSPDSSLRHHSELLLSHTHTSGTAAVLAATTATISSRPFSRPPLKTPFLPSVTRSGKVREIKVQSNSGFSDGWTPIHFAVENGHAEIVEFLATLAENPFAPLNGGETPLLLLAAHKDRKDVFKILLEIMPLKMIWDFKKKHKKLYNKFRC